MGVIHIENVDETTMRSIRLRARINGRSFEDEVKVKALLAEAGDRTQASSERAGEADRIRAMTKGWSPETDSVAVIREIRER